MNTRRNLIVASLVLVVLGMAGCGKHPQPALDLKPAFDPKLDLVFQTSLTAIRLGDGVPVELGVTVRWRIENAQGFLTQFSSPDRFGEQVFKPKARELASRVANTFPSVDTVFTKDRDRFVSAIKDALRQGLGESTIQIKEIVLSDITFPQPFTQAMELVALKERELEAIKQKSQLALETSKSEEHQAEADGQVEIKKAEQEGKVAEINAKTEDKRRASLVARAETEAQIADRKARSDKDRQKLLAEAEVERKREIAKADLEERRAMKDLEVGRLKEMDQMSFEKEKALATLCANNPNYASFLVNRELASKVQIAVLPVGSDANFLNGLIRTSLTGKDDSKTSR